tara:strand:- start:887 stop:1468 length:582 start_codon:yes stop_codon:yes gene_type:complete
LRKLLFFTNNNNKLVEVNQLFKDLKTELILPSKFNFFDEPEETGYTFAENAKIKSSFGYKNFGVECFAEDSGICIEALGWKPGVYSKRFLNRFKDNFRCFENIIDRVKVTGKVRAYFQTSVCLTLNKNYHLVFEGKVKGTISKKIRGKSGFGYDPIFIPDGELKTFSQMSKMQKNKTSHRSIAINKLINFLSN